MTDPNMPQDKRGAEIYLLAKRMQLMKMAALISDEKITTLSQVDGYILSEVEKLDEALED